MSDQFVDTSDQQHKYTPLAQWLHHLLLNSSQQVESEDRQIGEDAHFPSEHYHSPFYPQIPNFALALLKHDPTATTHYAPLLFHLIACPTCHRAYLEIYDALDVALNGETRAAISLRPPSSASLATTSPRLLVFLCQLLISQARTILRQSHHTDQNQDAWGRSLLQQTMQISRHIMQGTLRQRALRDLVEVASLYEANSPPMEVTHSYSAVVGSGSGARGRTLRRIDAASRPNGLPGIPLRSASLEGSVTQDGEMLLLHLADLGEELRGKYLLISIPLGTLIEPIRWLGGNPYAIRSTGPVSMDGSLVTPIGRTDLLLSNPEEHNLVEVLFKKLDVRPLE